MELSRVGVQKDFDECVRKSLNCLKQTVHRILDIEDNVIETTKGGKDYVTGNRRKAYLSDGMPKRLATLSPALKYEVENVPNYLSDLAKEISKERVECDT